MSVEVDRLQKVRIQTEGTFGTAPANWNSSYAVRVRGKAMLARQLEMLPDETIQVYPDARPDSIPGLKRCTLELPAYLDSHGTPLTGSQAWSTYWLAVILQHVMGGLDVRTNMGSTAAAGWTTSSGDVASGTNMRQGGCIGVTPTASSGLFQMRRITTLATNTITTNIALSHAPAENDVVYGAATAYMADNPTATLQAILEGKEGSDQFQAFGLASSGMSLNIGRGKLREVTFNFRGCSWLATTGETFAEPTFGGGGRGVVKDSELQVVGYAAATARSLQHVAEIQIQPTIEYEEDESTAGIEGVVGYRRIPVRPLVKGMFLPNFEDLAWETGRSAKTPYQLWFQMGNAAGESVAIDVPKIQIVDVQPAPKGRKRGQRVSFESDIDRATTWTATPTEEERSGLRIHLG
ncbi:MAG: hypothetical protein IT374_26325 [Polyangiaceae bacterium]|nr:hypothetical protein [Polyangiaceae bacterium]